MKLRWAETASEHLVDIYDFIAFDNADAAPETTERLVLATERITQQPKLGRPGRVNGTRELVLPPYIVVYRIVADVISVEAALHGRRNR